MELKVNGNKVDIKLEGEKTIGEVLKAFEEEAAKNNATTIKINLDGKEIPAEEFDAILKEPVKENTILDLTVISGDDISATFKSCAKEFTSLSTSLKDLSVMLQSGKEKDANIIIHTFAAQIDRFCHAATLSALFPEIYSKLKIDEKDVASFFQEFAPLLADFEKALEEKDTVTIGDLAEYEISPRIDMIIKATEVFN